MTSTLKNRDGRLFEASSHGLKTELFIRWLYDTREPRGRYITASSVQRALFHAFFGHIIPCRDSIASQRKHIDDSISEHKTFGAEGKSGSSVAELGKHLLAEISNVKDHDIIEHQPYSGQGTSNTSLAIRSNIKPSPEFLEIPRPRGKETGFQRSLDNIIITDERSLDQDTANKGRRCNRKGPNQVVISFKKHPRNA